MDFIPVLALVGSGRDDLIYLAVHLLDLVYLLLDCDVCLLTTFEDVSLQVFLLLSIHPLELLEGNRLVRAK